MQYTFFIMCATKRRLCSISRSRAEVLPSLICSSSFFSSAADSGLGKELREATLSITNKPFSASTTPDDSKIQITSAFSVLTLSVYKFAFLQKKHRRSCLRCKCCDDVLFVASVLGGEDDAGGASGGTGLGAVTRGATGTA